LETTLVSVLANRPQDCEILVALSTPYDDPYGLKDEVVFVNAPPRASYTECANLGMRASQGAVVHLLSAGLEVAEGWADVALQRFRDANVAAVTPVVRSSVSGQVVAAGLNYARGGLRIVARDSGTEIGSKAPLGPLAEAAFYRRTALDAVGGLPAALGDQWADADLALALQFVGFRVEIEPQSIIFQPPRSTTMARSKRARGFRYGWGAEQVFWRNRTKTSRWSAVAVHAWDAAVALVRDPWPTAMLGQLAGRLVALGSLGGCHKRRKQLQEIQQAIAAQAVTRTTISERHSLRRLDSAHSALRPATHRDVRVAHE
jgi:hypothetical protein